MLQSLLILKLVPEGKMYGVYLYHGQLANLPSVNSSPIPNFHSFNCLPPGGHLLKYICMLRREKLSVESLHIQNH